MDRVEAFKSIAASAHQGKLAFPTNIDASLKIKRALDDPDCHLVQAAKLVSGEPLLSARVVALANSATFKRSEEAVTTVRAAVSQLGIGTVKSTLAAIIVRQFGASVADPLLQAQAVQLWKHTAHVASLAMVLARRATNIEPETAMFAGLMHEIGGFYLLSRARDFPGLLNVDADDWEDYGVVLIGRGVLKALEVPQPIVKAIEQLWHGIGALPPVTLGDTLALANYLAPFPSPFLGRGEVTTHDFRSEIDFAIGEETLGSILAESSAEVDSLATALLH